MFVRVGKQKRAASQEVRFFFNKNRASSNGRNPEQVPLDWCIGGGARSLQPLRDYLSHWTSGHTQNPLLGPSQSSSNWQNLCVKKKKRQVYLTPKKMFNKFSTNDRHAFILQCMTDMSSKGACHVILLHK
jgi:hypothetical protein